MATSLKRIPKEHYPGVIKIATLEESVSNSLISCLQTLPPVLRVSELIASIIECTNDIDEETIEEFINILFSLYELIASTDLSAENLAYQIKEIVIKDQQSFPISEDDAENLEERLKKLLSRDGTISASYKARSVLIDYKYIYNSSSVLTDMRPVFQSDISAEPSAIGIIHNLKIEYRGLDGPGEFFVALDTADLKQISQAIQRAIDKEKALRAMLEKADLRYLGEDNQD